MKLRLMKKSKPIDLWHDGRVTTRLDGRNGDGNSMVENTQERNRERGRAGRKNASDLSRKGTRCFPRCWYCFLVCCSFLWRTDNCYLFFTFLLSRSSTFLRSPGWTHGRKFARVRGRDKKGRIGETRIKLPACPWHQRQYTVLPPLLFSINALSSPFFCSLLFAACIYATHWIGGFSLPFRPAGKRPHHIQGTGTNRDKGKKDIALFDMHECVAGCKKRLCLFFLSLLLKGVVPNWLPSPSPTTPKRFRFFLDNAPL